MTATVEAQRLETPTGLSPAEIRSLRREERIRLDGWQQTNAGDDNGRAWLPAAIRRLTLAQRLAYAEDLDLEVKWIEREKRRVRQLDYFVESYGHVRTGDDDEPGPPIPFALWRHDVPGAIGARSQADVLNVLERERRIIVLKARQLGLTWLALHLAVHLISIDPRGRNAIVLGLSQDGGYAKRLLERAREINDLLPPWLRRREDSETRESKTEWKLVERGRMVSLAGTPDAPRSWQADLAIGDEWAFVRNNQAGPTTRALLPAARRIVLISSGNGPPEARDKDGKPAKGAYFARTAVGAFEGSNEWTGVFLPTSTHPARDAAWRERERDSYDADEDFFAEHPETPDEALIGAGRDRFFPLAEISKAIERGRELDALLGTDDMPPPAGELIHSGHDWGEQSAAVVVWPLEGGGVYVPPCELFSGEDVELREPGAFCLAWHRLVAELQDVDRDTGRLEPLIGEARYDAAGAQSMRTFLATARGRFAAQYAVGEVRSRKVPFGKFKGETANYLRRLFRRVGQGRPAGVIAISPANVELIRQLRGLQSAGDGLWQKKDDHGPDALVAAVQRVARVHVELQGD